MNAISRPPPPKAHQACSSRFSPSPRPTPPVSPESTFQSTVLPRSTTLPGITLATIDLNFGDLPSLFDDAEAEFKVFDNSTARATIKAIVGPTTREHEFIQQRHDAAETLHYEPLSLEHSKVSSQGQRITIFGSATVPQCKIIAAMGVGGSLGVAVGRFLFLGLVNGKFHHQFGIQSRIGIISIVVFPVTASCRGRTLNRLSHALHVWWDRPRPYSA